MVVSNVPRKYAILAGYKIVMSKYPHLVNWNY